MSTSVTKDSEHLKNKSRERIISIITMALKKHTRTVSLTCTIRRTQNATHGVVSPRVSPPGLCRCRFSHPPCCQFPLCHPFLLNFAVCFTAHFSLALDALRAMRCTATLAVDNFFEPSLGRIRPSRKQTNFNLSFWKHKTTQIKC